MGIMHRIIENHQLLVIALTVGIARLIGKSVSEFALQRSQKETTRVYELRTPRKTIEKIEIGPNDNLDAKIEAAIKADKNAQANVKPSSADSAL